MAPKICLVYNGTYRKYHLEMDDEWGQPYDSGNPYVYNRICACLVCILYTDIVAQRAKYKLGWRRLEGIRSSWGMVSRELPVIPNTKNRKEDSEEILGKSYSNSFQETYIFLIGEFAFCVLTRLASDHSCQLRTALFCSFSGCRVLGWLSQRDGH